MVPPKGINTPHESNEPFRYKKMFRPKKRTLFLKADKSKTDPTGKKTMYPLTDPVD